MRKQDLQLVSETTLDDGRVKSVLSNGVIVITSPLPTDTAWRERVSREMSKINYDIMRRIAAERGSSEKNPPQ